MMSYRRSSVHSNGYSPGNIFVVYLIVISNGYCQNLSAFFMLSYAVQCTVHGGRSSVADPNQSFPDHINYFEYMTACKLDNSQEALMQHFLSFSCACAKWVDSLCG
jgi:hypothetical protein